ncbi:unnamed protein product [Parascedosporium putredinis]|uniref:Uncharacterized protein n=1 Tax=Parascedosporium putredinis TaxID=1442378 RepID=A0A9P1H9N9_9PEZI|nr:unnamed protein product [Parascedosporium putredinis]CAI8003775.1 unnamed protein product [Parascedosporium putredinis]
MEMCMRFLPSNSVTEHNASVCATVTKARREPKRETSAALDSSPTRPAKRRRKVDEPSSTAAVSSNATAGPSSAHVLMPSTDPVEEEESALGNASEGDQLVSRVVHYLTTPKDQRIQASKDHSNAIHEANKDGLDVNIGRASILPRPTPTEEDDDFVHIDLGPSKTVSRQHAMIGFDTKEEQWFFRVKGRNGAKINGEPMKSGTSRALASGEPLHIHETYLQRAGISPSELPSPAPAPFISTTQPSDDLPSSAPSASKASRSSQSGPSQQIIAPAPPNYRRPGTPPSAARRRTTMVQMTSPQAPGSATPFGMSLEIDLSKDDNRHIKPQFSYAQMITQSILHTDDGKLNLNGIYNFIMDNYAYYRHQEPAGWQNSIRHNLSLNKAFEKVPRSTDEPGKGMKWQIVNEYKDEMIRNAFKGGRGGHRAGAEEAEPPYPAMVAPATAAKTSAQRGADELDVPTAVANASVIVPPGRECFVCHSRTPRVHPRLAPPSTAPRPSQHMPTSSPAPFWKYADIGSTPLRPAAQFDASPSRRLGGGGGGGLLPHSSSPPARPIKSPVLSPSKPPPEPPSESGGGGVDLEEDQGFDLAKGFQSIGSYHAPVSEGVPIAKARDAF